jgi:hypothetical protein
VALADALKRNMSSEAAHQPKSHLELIAARRCVALASDKLRAIQNEGLRLKPFVDRREIPEPDAVDALREAARSNGLYKRHCYDDIEHVIRECLAGREALMSGWPRAEADARTMSEDRAPHFSLEEAGRPHAEEEEGPNLSREWPDPEPLPSGLLPVKPFDLDFLPTSIAPWIDDIARRMQCPPDFVGVSSMVALGAVLGRRIGVRPQRRTDWLEVPNFWGCIVGRPGSMKSPAISETLKPLHRLEAAAGASNEAAHRDYQIGLEAHKLRQDAARAKAKKALEKGHDVAGILTLEAPEMPKARRYVTNDTSYEKLGEILADNPNGVLAHRDELVSLLRTLDREEFAAARGFYLTAWSGTQPYRFDRIMRGKTHIDAACVSLFGSTQPGRLAEYARRALHGGAGDDGLIQRFSLLAWPNAPSDWVNVDSYPDSAARQSAWDTFERFDKLTADECGAEREQFEAIPFLRFDDEAQELFTEWRVKLEVRLRSGEMHSALESHLAKYRKLVPTLALINCLADGGARAIDTDAVLRALAFAEYLETHARRVYAAGNEADAAAAKAILHRIRRGDLSVGFTARDIHQRDWSSLTDRDQVQAGLALLTEYYWIAAATTDTGGRPKVIYRINPKVR